MIAQRRHRAGRLTSAVAVAAVALPLIAGCSSSDGPPSLVGTWSASDGTGSKDFFDGGACTGMYYNNGQPLDIGGGMTCSLGSSKNSDGRYALSVSQPPNSETLYLDFSGDSTATVYDGNGNSLFTMTKR